MSKVKFKIVNKSQNPLPSYSTPQSAGMDIRCDFHLWGAKDLWDEVGNGANVASITTSGLVESVEIEPLGRVLVPTGIYIQLPIGFEAQFRPRSGLALKHGLSLANAVGTIDSDYTGECCVILINLSNEPVYINNTERVCQMVISKHEHGLFEVCESVDEFSETVRGDGGFGHTGVK